MQKNAKKMDPFILPTSDLIDRQFESLGISIGDNLMILELYLANKNNVNSEKLRERIDQYAQYIDYKLSSCKTNLITDINDLNFKLFNQIEQLK